jgi:hypothetical protein
MTKQRPNPPKEIRVIDVSRLYPYIGAWTEEKSHADEKYFVHVDDLNTEAEDGSTAMILTGTANELRDFCGKLGIVVAETESDRLFEKSGRRGKDDLNIGRGIA